MLDSVADSSRSLAAATMRCSTSASAVWGLLLGVDTVNSEAGTGVPGAWTELPLHARAAMPETPGSCEAAHMPPSGQADAVVARHGSASRPPRQSVVAPYSAPMTSGSGR